MKRGISKKVYILKVGKNCRARASSWSCRGALAFESTVLEVLDSLYMTAEKLNNAIVTV
jgi:hypothetical protein